MGEKRDQLYDFIRRKLVAPFLIGVGLIVLFNILTAPTDIGVPATESDALIRANERLLEVVKWTISTILLIGGALIGLNWYTNEQRFSTEVKRIRDELETATEDQNRVILTLRAESLTHREMLLSSSADLFKLRNQIASTMLLRGTENITGGLVGAAINAVRRPDAQEFIRDQILDSILFQFQEADPKSSFTVFLGLDRLPELADAATELGHQEKAQEIRTLYRGMNMRRGAR